MFSPIFLQTQGPSHSTFHSSIFAEACLFHHPMNSVKRTNWASIRLTSWRTKASVVKGRQWGNSGWMWGEQGSLGSSWSDPSRNFIQNLQISKCQILISFLFFLFFQPQRCPGEFEAKPNMSGSRFSQWDAGSQPLLNTVFLCGKIYIT